MMDPWSILDVPRNADLRSLKRAYARKLKSANPEENPQEFQNLRAAYEKAMEALEDRRESVIFNTLKRPAATAAPESAIEEKPPLPDSTTSPLPPNSEDARMDGERLKRPPNMGGPASLNQAQASSEVQNPYEPSQISDSAAAAYDAYFRTAKSGDLEAALKELARWINSAKQEEKAVFDQHLFKAIVGHQIPRTLFVPLIWAFYHQEDRFHFQYQAPPLALHRLRQRIQQGLQEDLWDIRSNFAQAVAQDRPHEGLKDLEELLASPAFDSFMRRHMLRVIMLRFARQNPHLSVATLHKLNELFQFGSFHGQYAPADDRQCHQLQRRLGHIPKNSNSKKSHQPAGQKAPGNPLNLRVISLTLLLVFFLIGFAALYF